MCELFGLSSSAPASVNLSLSRLAAHGGLTGPHRDGWGVAYYEDRDVRLIKEAEPAADSDWIRFLAHKTLRTPLAMAHIRLATEGAPAYRNTQPFMRELGGRMHLFAHNGWLSHLRTQPDMRASVHRPVGETDSEFAFCVLLERLREAWGDPEQEPSIADRFAIVADFAARLRTLGPANFLYADGDVLFAHGDRRRSTESAKPVPPGLVVQLRSCKHAQADRAPFGVQLDQAPQHVALIASVALSEEKWRPLEEGELIALAAGRLIMSSSGESAREIIIQE